MARSPRQWEVDDGKTDDAKRKSRGAIAIPNGVGVFKPKKSGSHRLDIIPFLVTDNRNRFVEGLRRSKKPGVLFPHRIYWVHYGIGVNNEPFCCLSKNFGKKCPICQHRDKLLEKPDNESKKAAERLKAKERQLWLVYDNDETHKGVQLWEVSIHNFGAHIVDYVEGFRSEKEREKHKFYFHPVSGLSLNVTCKEESAGDRSYTDFLVHSMVNREEPLPEELFDHGIDLDAIPVEETYERLKRIYEGDDYEEEEGGHEEDNSVPPPKKESPTQNGQSEKPKPTLPLPTQKTKNRMEEEKTARKDTPRDDGKPYIFATGDKVVVEWKGEPITVPVVSSDIDNKTCLVKIPGRERPMQFPFEDLKLEEADTTFDLKSKDAWDDEDAGSKDDDDPVPPSKKKAAK